MWRGVSENGRDFREKSAQSGQEKQNVDIFTEHMSCEYIEEIIVCPEVQNGIEFAASEDGCYDFVDTNAETEGVYSAMWVQLGVSGRTFCYTIFCDETMLRNVIEL